MKLSATLFVSLDGVFQAPGGPDEDRSGGFDQGGWLAPYADEDMGVWVDGNFQRVEAFLLGRGTYEIFSSYWPNITDENNPVATKLNSLPKYVASRTLGSVEWNNASLLKGDLVDEVTKLKSRPGGELQVHGSGNLLRTLLAHELVDELHLLTYPVVLGTGKRLFPEGAPAKAFRLVHSRTTGAGVTINSYQPAGEPEYGDVGD